MREKSIIRFTRGDKTEKNLKDEKERRCVLGGGMRDPWRGKIVANP